VSLAQVPAPNATEPDTPSPQEAATLLNEAWSDPDCGLLLWLTMLSGARRGEECALRWVDVDTAAWRGRPVRCSHRGAQRLRIKGTPRTNHPTVGWRGKPTGGPASHVRASLLPRRHLMLIAGFTVGAVKG
jgi:integrase